MAKKTGFTARIVASDDDRIVYKRPGRNRRFGMVISVAAAARWLGISEAEVRARIVDGTYRCFECFHAVGDWVSSDDIPGHPDWRESMRERPLIWFQTED